MRTDRDIIDQTNRLARALYSLRGYVVPLDYKFYNATHPQEVEAWQAACIAQEILTDTEVCNIDPNDLEDEAA